MQQQRVSVFDLDKTITPFNTFRPFLLVVPISLLICCEFGSFFQYVKVVFEKALGRLDHVHFKAAVCKLSERVPHWAMHYFVRFCRSQARRSMLTEIEECRRMGHLLCLCTAAPESYAGPLAHLLGFDVCIGYGGTARIWEEGVDNVGAMKVNCLERAIPNFRCRIEAAFSDALSDVPILQLARRPVLVGATSSDIAAVQKHIPGVEIFVKCSDRSA